MPRTPRLAALLLPLLACLAACASDPAPTLTVIQPPRPALSVAEGELYRCTAAPLLADDVAYPDNVVILAGALREAYDACKAKGDHLIGVSTTVPGSKPAVTSTH